MSPFEAEAARLYDSERMSDRLFALRLFVRVARTRSFSAAGRELGLSQPSVSRLMATLEEEVGAALLTRSTRAVTLTEAGAEYLVRVESILAALNEADHFARGTGELRGALRIAASLPFALREIIPRLDRFLSQHPDLRIEFVLSDQRQDLVADAVDVAVRIGYLPGAATVARRIGVTHRVLVASPAYLRKAGTPRTPADLAAHALIVGPASGGPEGWAFRKDGKATSVRVVGRVRVTAIEAATAAAVAGLGIVSMGHLACRAELEGGALVRVLPDWEMGHADVKVLTAGRSAKPAARAFVEFLVGELRGVSEGWGVPPPAGSAVDNGPARAKGDGRPGRPKRNTRAPGHPRRE
jgi:DNA-binding transcriptional LysR family regulator